MLKNFFGYNINAPKKEREKITYKKSFNDIKISFL